MSSYLMVSLHAQVLNPTHGKHINQPINPVIAKFHSS